METYRAAGGPTVPICLHVGETDDEVHRRAAELDRLGRDRGIEGMPLFGVPCAVKHNIDVAGLATTAGCPAYRNWPERNASCVQRLLDAGAIVVGKTNMDQFRDRADRHPLPLRRRPGVFGAD